MKIKYIAFYLPQFHSIPENDEWWGKGFTDWVNVKRAKPLFKGHNQPRIPLNNNYYDLAKPDTLRWQASLMAKYNVYGLCFYHYWFNGKLLLEKPSEILLKNKDIKMNFCFSWANEPWARTWDGKNKHILMSQEYGNEEDWKKHFDYLLPFFKDERYIKVNNKPMFLIYKSTSIPCLKELVEIWNQMAVENGFEGIHFVETIRSREKDNRNIPFGGKVEFEPARSGYNQSYLQLTYKRIRRRFISLVNKAFHTSIPYNKPIAFKEMARLSLAKSSGKGTYGGVFLGWDNTPRRKLASTVILYPTKDEFRWYLKVKSEQTINTYKTSYVFINAWNEWAEGTMLEPDVTNNFSYLEVIKELSEEL